MFSFALHRSFEARSRTMSGAAQKERAVASVHQDNKEPSSKTTQGASSADDGAAAAASDGGGNQDEQNAPGGSERAAGSPEPNCAICLGALENKSFTDSCFHMFCFVCLQEWSKVRFLISELCKADVCIG